MKEKRSSPLAQGVWKRRKDLLQNTVFPRRTVPIRNWRQIPKWRPSTARHPTTCIMKMPSCALMPVSWSLWMKSDIPGICGLRLKNDVSTISPPCRKSRCVSAFCQKIVILKATSLPPPPLQFPQQCSTLIPLHKKGTLCEEEFQ